MIVKYFKTKKFEFNNYNISLLYGKNEGLQNEIIENYFLENFDGQLNKYEENEFILSKEIIISEILTKSLFDDEKIIIINRCTDRIVRVIDEILSKTLSGIKIILKTSVLEKKSKLRSLFEKNNQLVTIPFYEDNINELISIIVKFTSKNKINLSRESMNLLVRRSCGDRGNLKKELDKILCFSISNKNINLETVEKLTNLNENYAVNELAEQYLLKSQINISKILNENNYSDDDCILILRTILNKSKRLHFIIKKYNETNNLEEAISNFKPPVFWKEKENVKKQANTWELTDLKEKIYEINEIEALIKSNNKNSLNIVSNFIINH